MHLDVVSLRLLADVARLGSIGAAGRAAGMSQQSASERLRALERDVGAGLLARSPRGARLSPTGRLVVEWSTGLLEEATALEGALQSLREDRSRELRVWASLTIAETVLPGLLVRARRELPGRLALHTANSDAVATAVRDGGADLGFVEGPVDRGGLSARDVGEDELVVVASPEDPWAGRRAALGPATLAGRPLTVRERGSGTRRVWEQALLAAGTPGAPPEVELDTTAALLASVAGGGPPGVVSRRAAAAALRVGTLVEVRTTGIDTRRTFTALWVGGATPPAGPARDLVALVAAAGHRRIL